jgi:predicted component of type VI protein secretion system
MQDAIRSTVEKYEPRLRRVRVTRQSDEDNGQKLVFRVDGVMAGQGGEQRVWYETSVAASGELRVVG